MLTTNGIRDIAKRMKTNFSSEERNAACIYISIGVCAQTQPPVLSVFITSGEKKRRKKKTWVADSRSREGRIKSGRFYAKRDETIISAPRVVVIQCERCRCYFSSLHATARFKFHALETLLDFRTSDLYARTVRIASNEFFRSTGEASSSHAIDQDSERPKCG